MNIWLRCMVSLLLAGLSVACVTAQDVRIKKQPISKLNENHDVVYDKWWVSGALRDDVEPSILGTAYRSQADAVAYAKRWLEANHKVNKPTDWTYLKFVEVEGEYSVREKAKKDSAGSSEVLGGGSASDSDKGKTEKDSVGKGAFADSSIQYGSPEDKLFSEAIDRAGKILKDDIKAALKKRNMEIKDTFRRAKEAKEYMAKNVNKLQADQFRKVNGLVKQYNGTLMSFSSDGPGSDIFSRMKPLEPFSDEMIRQAIASQAATFKFQFQSPEMNSQKSGENAPAASKTDFAGEWKSSQMYLTLSESGDASYNHSYAFKSNGTWTYANGTVEIKTQRTEEYNGEPVYYKLSGTLKDGKLRLTGTESINFPVGRKESETGAVMERK